MTEKIYEAKKMDDPNRDRPSLSFYHPNGKGTGCALKVILHPSLDTADGYLEIRMASQATVGDLRSNPHSYPTFDWDNYRDFYLGVEAVGKMLMVLRGETESIDDGKGLYSHRLDTDAKIHLVFRHVIEPAQGYSLEMYSKYPGDDEQRKHLIFLSPAESLGLICALEHSIGLMCFGLHPLH